MRQPISTLFLVSSNMVGTTLLRTRRSGNHRRRQKRLRYGLSERSSCFVCGAVVFTRIGSFSLFEPLHALCLLAHCVRADQTWERAKQLRSSVLLLLEQARTGGLIRSPAEAQVYLLGPQGDASSPEQIRWQELTEALAPSTEALLTSQVTFLACPQTHEHRVSMARRAGGIDGWCLETSLEVGTCEVADSSTSDDTSKHIRIALTRADGAKCQRCVPRVPVQQSLFNCERCSHHQF